MKIYIYIHNSRCELSLEEKKKSSKLTYLYSLNDLPFSQNLNIRPVFIYKVCLRFAPDLLLKWLQSMLIEIFLNAILGTSFAVAKQSIRQSSICYCELLGYDNAPMSNVNSLLQRHNMTSQLPTQNRDTLQYIILLAGNSNAL